MKSGINCFLSASPLPRAAQRSCYASLRPGAIAKPVAVAAMVVLIQGCASVTKHDSNLVNLFYSESDVAHCQSIGPLEHTRAMYPEDPEYRLNFQTIEFLVVADSRVLAAEMGGNTLLVRGMVHSDFRGGGFSIGCNECEVLVCPPVDTESEA